MARRLGADVLINYEKEDFAKRMLAEGDADIVLDTVGGKHLAKNVEASVNRLVLPFLTAGAIRPVTEKVDPLSEAATAHAHFETKAHIGKILLDCRQTE